MVTNFVTIVEQVILALVGMTLMFGDKNEFIYSSFEESLNPSFDFFEAMLSTSSGKNGRTYCAILALKW